MDPLLQSLARYDSPTLANAIETFNIQPRDVGFADSRVKCMFPELGRMVGYAATATIVARSAPRPGWAGAGNDALYKHVRTIRAPGIVVVKDLDDPPAHGALWGEVHATILRALGCVGCVTDGAVRDLDEARRTGFHFFAAGPPFRTLTCGSRRSASRSRSEASLLPRMTCCTPISTGVLRIPLEIEADLPRPPTG
jgi:regulator of RNase E activity RraA